MTSGQFQNVFMKVMAITEIRNNNGYEFRTLNLEKIKISRKGTCIAFHIQFQGRSNVRKSEH